MGELKSWREPIYELSLIPKKMQWFSNSRKTFEMLSLVSSLPEYVSQLSQPVLNRNAAQARKEVSRKKPVCPRVFTKEADSAKMTCVVQAVGGI